MTRPPVEVRRAVVGDLDDLLLLWSQAREELGRSVRGPAPVTLDQLRPRLREALQNAETHVLLARWEGRPAGYAVLRLAPLLAVLDGPALHVDHLFVLPAVRRRGIARALLSAATSIAERHGAEQVLAGAAPSARDTHRFLARLGFSPLVVRRAVTTSTLRRRLAGEGQRRGLEDLLSRRRSLRARALRTGWGGGSANSPDAETTAAVPALDSPRPGSDPAADLVRLEPGCPDPGCSEPVSSEPDSSQPDSSQPVGSELICAELVCAEPGRAESPSSDVSLVVGDLQLPEVQVLPEVRLPPDPRSAPRTRRRARS